MAKKQPALSVLDGDAPDPENGADTATDPQAPDSGAGLDTGFPTPPKETKDTFLGMSKEEWDKARELVPVEGDIDPGTDTMTWTMRMLVGSVLVAQRAKVPGLDKKLIEHARGIIEAINSSKAGLAPTQEEGLPVGPPPAGGPGPGGPPAMGGPPQPMGGPPGPMQQQ